MQNYYPDEMFQLRKSSDHNRRQNHIIDVNMSTHSLINHHGFLTANFHKTFFSLYKHNAHSNRLNACLLLLVIVITLTGKFNDGFNKCMSSDVKIVHMQNRRQQWLLQKSLFLLTAIPSMVK